MQLFYQETPCLLLHGHVEVVDHDHAGAAHGRPIDALAPALQLCVHQILLRNTKSYHIILSYVTIY